MPVNSNDLRPNSSAFEIFEKLSSTTRSPMFRLNSAVSVQAFNLQEGDVITFYQILFRGDDKAYTSGDCCTPVKPIQGTQTGEQLLMCPECVEERGFFPIRITSDNPVIILDSPIGAILQAEINESALGRVLVRAVAGAFTDNPNVEYRGCPKECCEDIVWNPTGTYMCDVESNEYRQLYVSNCGHTKWEKERDLNWQDAGSIHCYPNATDDEVGSAKIGDIVTEATDKSTLLGMYTKSQKDDCGDLRWVVAGKLTWTDTGDYRCDVEANTQSKKQTDDCGDPRWIADGELVWTDTGNTECIQGKTWKQQATVCGNTRWINTEAGCGYGGSYPLPDGGWAYGDGDNKDPAATVELTNCDGTGLGLWIYPEPHNYPLATVPVTNCDGRFCTPSGEVFGYALNQNSAGDTCNCQDGISIAKVPVTAIGFYRQGDYLVTMWNNGRTTQRRVPRYRPTFRIPIGTQETAATNTSAAGQYLPSSDSNAYLYIPSNQQYSGLENGSAVFAFQVGDSVDPAATKSFVVKGVTIYVYTTSGVGHTQPIKINGSYYYVCNDNKGINT